MNLRRCFAVAVVVLSPVASAAPAGVIITELMFDPASDESAPAVAEWVEIYNNGSTAATLTGWKLDDEDIGVYQDWGAIPAGTTLNAGGVLVLFDAAFATNAAFRAEWNVPAEALVIGIGWGNLSNSPLNPAVEPSGQANEVLQLLDSGGIPHDTVNYDNDGTVWPLNNNKASIYLKAGHLIETDNDLGSNWALSTIGTDNGRNPGGSAFNAADVGSPGQVPVPEPAVLALFLLPSLLLRRSRMR